MALESKTICMVAGCGNSCVAKYLCSTHYKRYTRHGHVRETRSSDWGKREKHQLYKSWCNLIRFHKTRLCEEWRNDFWNFVADVKEKPDGNHRLAIADRNKTIDKHNCYWKAIDKSDDTSVLRAKRIEYQKKYRALHPEIIKDRQLRKNYGITIEDWNNMFQDQAGVCKLCGNPEKVIDRKQGVVRSLAVDHCHNTGKVRGLLCADCNTAIGLFKHDPDLLAKAAKYCNHSKDEV